MKTTTLLFLLIFVFAISNNAQNYQISFAGTGAATKVDSVKVENLTQCKSINISGSDILHLVESIVGVNELNKGNINSVNIYPNPMTDNCLMDFNATAQGNTIIKLYDISGKLILQEQELLQKGHQTYRLSGINSGVYIINVESNEYSYNAKIISNNRTYSTTEIKHIATPAKDKQMSSLNAEKGNNEKSIINMQYTTDDLLKFTGFSGGIYRTIVMLTPTSSQSINFNFVDCSDADGNHYAVVQIGTQLWAAENLKTTKFEDGSSIPEVTSNSAWDATLSPAYCYYSNNPSYNDAYGKMYNWYTGNRANNGDKNLCGTGWHVPSEDEWQILKTYLGNDPGSKLKETCSTLWQTPNTATNLTGFTALPGGDRFSNGTFYQLGYIANFWTSYECHPETGAQWKMELSNSTLNGYCSDKNRGFNVRCLKD